MTGLTHATIVPGWTLRPSDNWYPEVAEALRNEGLETQIADMPTPDTPDPAEWTAALDTYLRPTESHLVIAHSLGFMATINWAAGRVRQDAAFRLGSIIDVAGNISPVGFDEIAPHFDDDITVLEEKMTLVRDALQYQPVGIYGIHDPFVGLSHGEVVRKLLHIGLLVDPQQGHFSGMYVDQHQRLRPPETPTMAHATAEALRNLDLDNTALRDILPDLPNPVQPYDAALNKEHALEETQPFPILTAARVLINLSRQHGPMPYGTD